MIICYVIIIVKAKLPDLNLGNYFNSNDFMEQKFNSANTNLGEKLHKLYNNIEKDPYSNYQFDLDFFYFLTESIISDYIPIVKQFNSVRSVKSATKKDLIRRLEKGKKYIDENFQRDIEIINVANEAHISQYHFFRLFRNVYNISPLQYIKQKKMEKAKGLIHKMPINQIANEVGYNDIFSFSKAYKKHFGYAPSETLK
ncbi:MAG: helix-turn-helix transcriptional regulator [Saprospiraceae bacterium]|nr:helix-turn-helix transcriptional regulator [Saprospiraceae bacterium]